MEKLLSSLHVCDEILFLLHENKNKLRFVLTIRVFVSSRETFSVTGMQLRQLFAFNSITKYLKMFTVICEVKFKSRSSRFL